MNHKKKLIEVALPLEAINIASAREKSIRHGHPSTLHLWWARRPLAAARAVIFAQMVDDPSSNPDLFPTVKKQEKERQRLFKIIEELVKWENTTNETVLQTARNEIWQSWRRACAENADHPRAKEIFDRNKLPAFHDPFAGGGALPLEAQRLGLEAYASDLNPVAVLINKAMIEIPPKFAGWEPVNPAWRDLPDNEKMGRTWKGAQGLADDVRYYGQWMRDEAEKRIGHLYPKIEITAEMVKERPDLSPYLGQKLTVIAWIWARTVKSPNPAFADVDVPLASTFMLSTKKGKEAYVEPVITPGRTGVPPAYSFKVKIGTPPPSAPNGTSAGKRAAFKCLMSGTPIPYDYIRTEGQSGHMAVKLMAMVVEGDRKRVYLSPTAEMETIAISAKPTWKPETTLPVNPRDFKTPNYGMTTFADLFTSRQLVALTTFSDLVLEAREKVKHDYLGARASRPSHEWHSRGYLPHWEAGEVPQHITFRLHDSLPREVLDHWQKELANLSDSAAELERRKRIEEALDQGQGACHLRNAEIASLVENALLHFDNERYRLHAWVIMPNHVHVLATPLYANSLSSIIHSWKSFTAKEANRILNTTGQFWQEEYYDRAIRDGNHYARAVEYIEQNPVKAHLCKKPDEWPFSHLGPSSLGPWASRPASSLGSSWASRPQSDNKYLSSESNQMSNALYENDHRQAPCETNHGRDARGPRGSQDSIPLVDGGTGAQGYADAVAVYLGFVIDKAADYWSTICTWHSSKELIRNTFGRQAIPMSWDYVETNIFSESSGNVSSGIEWAHKVLHIFPSTPSGFAMQGDAQSQNISINCVVSTDPPYYDNIGYADLSDFFYVWLRRSLKPVLPELFSTLEVPKVEELVATPYRHGSKEKAESFFLGGMTKAMHQLYEQSHPAFPVTIYYAFKQSETEDIEGTSSTGWETFLDAVIHAGFALTGTWPMRTELSNRMISSGTNALASSIILVCRKRTADAPTATRRDFINALKAELPAALAHLQAGNIAPVDLAQAAIGPGMGVYTRYAKVLDADGKPLSVRDALSLINQTLDDALAEQEGDFDADSRFALSWFEQMGFAEGEFGLADVLARAKNTSVSGLVEAGVLESKRGKVRLFRPAELPADWDPATDNRLTTWEMVHHLIRVLEASGEGTAAELVAKLDTKAETARELCYRLYTICERKKRAPEALAYNALVQSWPEIVRLSKQETVARQEQTSLFE